MKNVVIRLLARERGLFAGALIVGAAAAGLGIPVDFVLFAITLAGVALFHHHTLQVALTGLAGAAAAQEIPTTFAPKMVLSNYNRHLATGAPNLTDVTGNTLSAVMGSLFAF